MRLIISFGLAAILVVGAVTMLKPVPARSGSGQSEEKQSETATPKDLAAIRAARILFLHHSVGDDILDGMSRLDKETGGSERLARTDLVTGKDDGKPAILEYRGGTNGAPDSKIDAFVDIMEKEGKAHVDVAFMKLCFVDFNPRTDVPALFKRYKDAVDKVQARFPQTRIAHVTVPLMEYPWELKWRVYRLVGKEVWEDEANAKRAEFNALMKRTFQGSPVFDLATAEATRPDGRRATFRLRGGEYQVLYSGYTVDGGHLNDAGKRTIASKVVRFLARTLDQRPQ